MAYDEMLADRVRALVEHSPAIREKRMFGGLAFLVNGNMSVAASRRGGLLVRVDPQQADDWIDGQHVAPAVMGGREMTGWLYVDPAALRTARQLKQWVGRGVGYAASLPAKR